MECRDMSKSNVLITCACVVLMALAGCASYSSSSPDSGRDVMEAVTWTRVYWRRGPNLPMRIDRFQAVALGTPYERILDSLEPYIWREHFAATSPDVRGPGSRIAIEVDLFTENAAALCGFCILRDDNLVARAVSTPGGAYAVRQMLRLFALSKAGDARWWRMPSKVPRAEHVAL